MKKIVSIILTLVILVVITGCGSSIDSFENQVKSGNYSNAIEIYKKNIVGNSESENTANSFLQDFLDEGLTDYVDGTITEQEFLNRYTTIDKINYEIWTVYDLDWVYQQYLNVRESKKSYSIAVEYADKGDFEVAISAFSQVISEDIENYSDAQDKLADVTKIYQEKMIENAKQLAGTDNFEEAAMCINQASAVIGFTAELENCLRNLVTQKYADSIDIAFSSGNYVTVIREYSNARCDSYVTISSDMTNKYSSSITNYLNDVSKQAEDAFGDSKDYSAAIRILQVALSEVDMDENVVSEIEQKIEFYQEYIPVYLTSLEYTQIARYISVGAIFGEQTDVNGTQYEADTVIYPTGGSLFTEIAKSDDESYVLYNINLKYSTLTGTIYRPYESLLSKEVWNMTYSGAVKIYGDDALLYEAPDLTTDMYDPINFNVDVTGVRNLKIVLRGVWTESTGWVGMYNRNPIVCMAEVTLQK